MEEKIGRVVHYYTNLGVVAIDLTDGNLKVGDRILIKGHTTNFEQQVESMQIEHANVNEAQKGQSIGIRVKEHVRDHDIVYKVT
ncbi:MAG: EF-Tu/IF-2/RF-3 family GTPase [Nitrospirota bacterium]|jgi:translation elongation factor EF-1alpha